MSEASSPAFVAGLADDYGAIRREAVALDFGKDVGSASLRVVVAFEHQCCCSAARNQSVAVAVEGTAGFCRLVHAFREGTECVERGHAIVVCLLCSAAQHRLLQALFDEQIGQADGVAAAGTGCTDAEVHAFQVEGCAQVHVHGGVHGLEDVVLSEQFGVSFLLHNLGGLDDGLCRRVVAEDAADFVGEQIGVAHLRHTECFKACHIGIFGFFGEATAEMAVEQSFEHRCLDLSGQSGLIAVAEPVGLHNDTGPPFAERIPHFCKTCPEARPNAHSRYYDSVRHKPD